MKSYTNKKPTFVLALAISAIGFLSHSAPADTLRIVNYNIAADLTSNGTGTLGAGLETVLEGIGNEHLNDNGSSNAQPIDVLALEEVSVNPSAMLQSIVDTLNATYGAGTYAYDHTTDPIDGNLTGNGPNALIYNTKTVKVVSATPLGSVGSGAARAPMQYLLQPIGFPASADFYLDVSHAKSGTTASDATRRNVEATTLVNNLHSLGSNAHVIALGDFNITGGSSEQTYQTITTGTTAFHDSAHPTGAWSDTTASARRAISPLLSESADDVEFRDDIQFVSPAADSNSGSSGLQYDAGSITVFGNGGSMNLVNHSIASSSNSGVFPDFSSSSRTTVLDALLTASDHLPVVADYDIIGVTAIPEPTSLMLLGLGTLRLFGRRRKDRDLVSRKIDANVD